MKTRSPASARSSRDSGFTFTMFLNKPLRESAKEPERMIPRIKLMDLLRNAERRIGHGVSIDPVIMD